jgi:hypothetical protein
VVVDATRSRPRAGGGTEGIEERIARLDWRALEAELWERGHAQAGTLLTPAECAALVELDEDDRRFRSRIDMARFRFGEGRYGYFADPLPPLVATLRTAAYARLAPIANAWSEVLGDATRFPARLATFRRTCRAHGQTKPTPLLLRYEAGGYNCLHRDVYGDVFFPLQLTCFLGAPGDDYEGGEFLLVEQRPRAQSRGESIVAARGEMLIFAGATRPLRTRHGFARAHLRHGVSTVRSGVRWALGMIFHDAR